VTCIVIGVLHVDKLCFIWMVLW